VLKGLNRKIELISLEFHADAKNMTITSQCLNLLEQQGDIDINIISFRNYEFAWKKWATRNDFEKRFAAELADDPAFAYGDVFIRYRS
jgi:hypothetical protein